MHSSVRATLIVVDTCTVENFAFMLLFVREHFSCSYGCMLVVLQVQCVSQIAFSEHYASMPDTITSIKHIKILIPWQLTKLKTRPLASILAVSLPTSLLTCTCQIVTSLCPEIWVDHLQAHPDPHFASVEFNQASELGLIIQCVIAVHQEETCCLRRNFLTSSVNI